MNCALKKFINEIFDLKMRARRKAGEERVELNALD